MNRVTVKDIKFYGEETASVILESSSCSVEVFCHLCDFTVGEEIHDPLKVLDYDARSLNPDNIDVKNIERLEKTGPFSYSGCGKVVDHDNGIIEVKGFRIELDDLPHCGLIEFEIERLEI